MKFHKLFSKSWLIGIAIALILSTVFALPKVVQAVTVPTISIISVDSGNSVKIQANNFPAGQTFTIRMGAYGTLAVGGTVVATTDSGAGGTFVATYAIPASLKTADRIAIRMDSDQGYYAYNWFWNIEPAATTVPGGTTPVPGPKYTGIPTFAISAVTADSTVTIAANNFPPNQKFTVRMGKYGTLGVGGTIVATTETDGGGAFTAKYDIPDGLKDQERIAIRLDSAQGYYAYNWFWNSTGATAPAATPVPGSPTVAPAAPKYTGYPYFSIQAVVKDSKVTINARHFPAGQTFTVRMGAYGTLAIGGTAIATMDSGAGGDFVATYDLPASVKGLDRIAIRMDSAAGYYAYNWFWNTTTP
jgi:hypothetical protein